MGLEERQRRPHRTGGSQDRDDLNAKALAALHRPQKLPALIRGLFADANLRYITA